MGLEDFGKKAVEKVKEMAAKPAELAAKHEQARQQIVDATGEEARPIVDQLSKAMVVHPDFPDFFDSARISQIRALSEPARAEVFKAVNRLVQIHIASGGRGRGLSLANLRGHLMAAFPESEAILKQSFHE